MAEWIETFKGAVLAWEYDPDAHMNTQLYVSRFDQATWFLLASAGVTPASIRKRRRRIALVRQTVQFIHELRGGELIVINSGFVAVGQKYLRFVHRMFEQESGAMAATCDCTAVQASLASDKSVVLSPTLRKSAEALLVTWNEADLADR